MEAAQRFERAVESDAPPGLVVEALFLAALHMNALRAVTPVLQPDVQARRAGMERMVLALLADEDLEPARLKAKHLAMLHVAMHRLDFAQVPSFDEVRLARFRAFNAAMGKLESRHRVRDAEIRLGLRERQVQYVPAHPARTLFEMRLQRAQDQLTLVDAELDHRPEDRSYVDRSDVAREFMEEVVAAIKLSGDPGVDAVREKAARLAAKYRAVCAASPPPCVTLMDLVMSENLKAGLV